MSDDQARAYTELILPTSVIDRADISHLVSEAERLDADATTNEARERAGAHNYVKPEVSKKFTEFLSLNKQKVDDANARSDLIKELRFIKDHAPVMHMTFASEADQDSLMRLVTWLRQSIHPQALIAVGLQPSLVAGVYLRTPNHVHDLSLRSVLKKNRGLLVKELEALRGTAG